MTELIGPHSFSTVMHGLGSPNKRVAEPRRDRRLPSGTIVVSADSHWSLTDDIFYERFPEHLRDRAPRLGTSDTGEFGWTLHGKSIFPEAVQAVFADYEALPGCTQIEPRLHDMDVEGIDKEIVFGNGFSAFHAYPDLEVREWGYAIYNEYLAEMQARAPGRFYGVGVINYWDMSKTRASIARVKELGLKTFMIPQYPKGANGAVLNYCADEMRPLWEAIEDAGLPLCFHVGEVWVDGPGGIGTTAMVSFAPFRKTMGELIFGGILDRHPSLQVVFAEGDINWVPGALQTATMVYENFSHLIRPKIKHHPEHYWRTNCYATFMSDLVGLEMLDRIGADRVMWSSDYPHVESVFGCGWKAMQQVIDAVSEDEARMILGGTAISLFDLV